MTNCGEEDPLLKLKKALNLALFIAIFVWFLAIAYSGGY